MYGQLLTFLYARIWLNRYYRGVVQGTTKEKYYNVLFDDGSFCNDLRSADIVVSTILAMCNIYKFIYTEWAVASTT